MYLIHKNRGDMLYRFIQNRLETLFKYFPCVLLTGARQVGKTTLIKELVAADSIVTFDPIEDIRGAKADPDLFLKQMKSPGFLDEVQYVPQVLASLKRFVDEHANDKSLFYLSGSQNLSVLRGAAESMAGRIAVLDLYPLCFKEIFQKKEHGILEALLQNNEDDFSKFGDGSVPPLNRLMWRGGMPGLLDMPDQLISDFFTRYMRTYIERDVRSIAEISNLNLFSRFVRLLSALSAQEINSNELGRDLGIDRTTAVRWENICEASYQWIKIPSFNKNPIKRISSKSKGYFVDTGLLCYLQGIFSPEILVSHPLYGHIFETFVVMEVVKRINAWHARPNLYHYRTYSGAEVDLLMEYNGKVFPLEIKIATHPTKKDVKGIISFKETFPNENIATAIVACNTPTPYKLTDDVWAVPWWEL